MGKTMKEADKRKKRRSRRRRQERLAVLFLTVFLSVITLGGLTLICMRAIHDSAMHGARVQAETGERENGGTDAALSPDGQGGAGLALEPEIHETQSTPETSGKYGELLADPELMAENNRYELSTAQEGRITLAFAGDILFDDAYSPMVRLRQRGGEIASCFSDRLMEEMHSADLFMLNNEFTYTDRGVPTPEKQFTFRAKPGNVAYLKDIGADLVSLANNHAYDYGEISLLDTFDTLEGAGIPYVGAGRNLEEAVKPVSYIAGDIKFAVVSATQIERQDNPNTKGATEQAPGVFRCWNPDKLYETIARAKQENDFVIVYIHWGTENTNVLDWAQREQAKGIAQAGADLIIGNHPHCLQEVGYVEGVPVIYSLGNYWFNSKTVDTCLVKAVLGEDGLESLQFVPAVQKDCRTDDAQGAEKDRIINYVNSISTSAYLDGEGMMYPKG